MGPPDRLGPPDRMGPPGRDDRVPPVGSGPPPRAMPAPAGPPQGDPYGRYDEPTGTFGGGYDAGPRGYDGPPAPAGPPPGAGPRRFDEPDDRFDGFEAGRHGRMDMTAEIRLPDRDLRAAGPRSGPPPERPPVDRPPYDRPPVARAPFDGPPVDRPPFDRPQFDGPPPLDRPQFDGPPPLDRPQFGGPPPVGGDAQRVDEIRRTFQVRRFGSGYDPVQVDRLFEQILMAMSGRGPMPVDPAGLDNTRFELVPGGYFEAEVEAALKEVQDILRRH
ncbi:hypothetical protein Prubr_40100 [Polymorphospora rubra]|uniref:DivIVA domain-containing protein n=2 Tax=Polymorphospora rubra TaxID=338584 RepID=A0A810N461_9ACTN|nr:hypothetical protein Prubr_40100 [Polymorphospora rubra]